MMTKVAKQLWCLSHMALSGVGLMLTCSGAYLLSLQTEHEHTWRAILAYVMITLGFLAVLGGVFWTMCHSMKSKLYQRVGHEWHIHVCTIER